MTTDARNNWEAGHPISLTEHAVCKTARLKRPIAVLGVLGRICSQSDAARLHVSPTGGEALLQGRK